MKLLDLKHPKLQLGRKSHSWTCSQAWCRAAVAMPTSTHNVDGTCYWCVIWFQTFIFLDIKSWEGGGGGVGVAMYDPYYGKGTCLQMQRSVSFKPF